MGMKGGNFLFANRLEEGVIKARPNRFVMLVEVHGKIVKCHCPSTGRIGSIRFVDVPCLLSKSADAKRKMPYTVEAFSLDGPAAGRKRWIGINQVKANRYVEHFLRSGRMPRIAAKGALVERERKVGRSRIDFSVNGDMFVEVKTMLVNIPCEGHPNYVEPKKGFNGTERMARHFRELGRSVVRGGKAVLLMCFLYDAKPFRPPRPTRDTRAIHRAARKAAGQGMEYWQANFKVDEKGVELRDYFPLKLFD